MGNHICKSCGKSFNQVGELKDHIQTIQHKKRNHIHTIHEGRKEHKCESCGKSFSDASNLKKHIHTIHEGHKNYKCESCGKSFSQASILKNHIQSIQHKKRNPNWCKYCDEELGSKLKLHEHIKKIQ